MSEYNTNKYDGTFGKNRNVTRSRDAVNRYRMSRRKKSNALVKIFVLIFIVVFVIKLKIIMLKK